MKRWLLSACLIAALAVQPVVAGIPAALAFTGTTSLVNVGSAASLDNMTQGTTMAWVKLASAVTAARVWQKAYLAAHSSFIYLSLNEPGGEMSFQLDKPTDLAVFGGVSPTVGVWTFVAAQWNINGAATDQKLFSGTLDTPATEVSSYSSQSAGSGSRTSDAAASLYLGNRQNGSVQLGGSMALVIISTATLTVDEIRRLQYQPRPSAVRGCVGFWRPGAYGTGRVFDECGLNHGTPTAAVPVSDYLPRVAWRRPT